MPAVQTVGASPKKIAATITSLVAAYAVGVAAHYGLKLDVNLATAVAGPLVLSGCTYLAAHLAGPGKVYVDQTLYPDAFTGPNPPARVAPTVPEAEPEKPKRGQGGRFAKK
jgi:hypothetical protein